MVDRYVYVTLSTLKPLYGARSLFKTCRASETKSTILYE